MYCICLLHYCLQQTRISIHWDDSCIKNENALSVTAYKKIVSVFWSKRLFSGNITCSWSRFPLTVAYATTVHKAQGTTVRCAVLNLSSRGLLGRLTYVVILHMSSTIKPTSTKNVSYIELERGLKGSLATARCSAPIPSAAHLMHLLWPRALWKDWNIHYSLVISENSAQ